MNKNIKNWATLGALMVGFGIIAGAFGAHGLKTLVPEKALESYKTGVSYWIFHSIVIFSLSFFKQSILSNKALNKVLTGLTIGTLLFSGSILLLVLNYIFLISQLSYLGPVTPIGGSILIITWFYLAWCIYKSK